MDFKIAKSTAQKIFGILASCCLCIALLSGPAVSADMYKVIRVTDGDTVTAQGPAGKIKIRLVGIDAPETGKRKNDPGQPFSQASKKYLAQLTLNKFISLISYGKDRYGRILGEIFVDGANANLTMVYYGLAEVYRGRPPKGMSIEKYKQAEVEAQGESRGIWSQGSDYVSPKIFRQTNRKK